MLLIYRQVFCLAYLQGGLSRGALGVFNPDLIFKLSLFWKCLFWWYWLNSDLIHYLVFITKSNFLLSSCISIIYFKTQLQICFKWIHELDKKTHSRLVISIKDLNRKCDFLSDVKKIMTLRQIFGLPILVSLAIYFHLLPG